jgi:hypothetical protein
MKLNTNLIKLLSALVLMAAAAWASPLRTSVILAWNYPTNELSTNLVFKIYASPDSAVPLTNWTLLMTVTGTNLQATVSLNPTNMFFFVTASNLWGESDPSNVVSAPAPPRSGFLQIK